MMRYLSVCSGIEAATVAWHPLGWRAVAYSEIEKFPAAVLAHHYPETPNWGDMEAYRDWPDADIDVLAGGTPCQSFSVAGLRGGLADPRGNLALVYLGIAERYRPRWVVWENVPGVRSSDEGRALGAFLGGLAELGYWWAYRSLDAEYAGLAQRRERVFVVGCLGDWRRAAAVLFERESLSGDTPACVAARQDAARRAAAPAGCRRLWQQIARAFGAGAAVGQPDISGAVSAKWAKGTGGPAGDECYNLVAHSLRADGFDASEDGTGRGTPIVPAVANPLRGQENSSHRLDNDSYVAFSAKDYGADAGSLAPTLRGMGHDASHANGGGQVAIAIQERGRAGGRNLDIGGDIAYSLNAPNGGGRRQEMNVAQGYTIRRLTPQECESLQGFPRGYTAIPWRGKPAEQCPDGPRYKALGNSMAVPVMRWIGERIQKVESL